MTRTGKSARLLTHIFEPCAEFHPEDARLAGLENEALVRLTSPWGKMVARVAISAEQRRGCVFVPMHWNEEFAGAGRVNALVNPVTDPLSGQPESKHTPVKAEPYAPNWHVFILSRHEIRRPPCEYWVQGKVGECFRLELAFDQRPASWREWAAEQLGIAGTEIDWIAYRDPAAGRFRYAAVSDRRLQGCVFVAPDHRLGSRSWLIGLFGQQQLSSGARNALLAGQPLAAADDIGAVICSCFGIGRNQIATAIQNGAASVDAVGQRLKAGTNCGACKPEIGKLLATARPSTRAEIRTSEGARG